MRRGCWSCGRARALEDRVVRDLPDLLAPGDVLVVQRHARDPGRAARRARARRGRRHRRRQRCTSASAPSAGAPSPGRPSGCRPATASASARHRGQRLPAGRASTPTVAAKGEGGEVDAALRPRRRRPRRGDRRHRPHAAAALHRRHGAPTTPRPRPTTRRVFAARRRRGRRADRRPAFHARAAGARSRRRGIVAALRHAACRRRHLPAGARPTTPTTTACTPNGARSPPRPPPRSTTRRARGRPHRRGRHHLAAPAGKRGRRGRRARSPSRGETDIFITPGYRFRAVDLLMTNFHLPRSTLFMLVSAFAGLETHARRLCPRHRGRLPLLFLRRRLPCSMPERRRMTAFSFERPRHATAPRAAARITTAARRDPHAGLHAGRHRRHRQGDVPRAGAGARRRHRARQHLSPDAAAGRGARRARSAACTAS